MVILQHPFVTALPSTYARHPSTLLAFVFGLLLAGCSVLFIAPYDATTDRLLTDLTVQTETVVVKADNDQLSVGEQEKFYAEAEGTVNTMKMRAGLYAKNEQEIAALDELGKRYHALHERHAARAPRLTAHVPHNRTACHAAGRPTDPGGEKTQFRFQQ